MARAAGIDPAIYARRWWILAVLCTSLVLIIVGNTALNVALPTLARQLDASTSSLQWMVDAYALVFAGLLFTAGALGDRFGRKGALQFGLLVFLGGALLAATANAEGQIIGGRAIMGVGAAFVMPSTLSILANVFPPAERTKAIAIWAGLSGAGGAIGPVTSGFLLEHFWWGSVFLVNVPIVVIALAAGQALLPTSRDPDKSPLDLFGASLSIAGVVALVYAIIEAPRHGWLAGRTLGLFAVAVLLLVAFVLWELRVSEPMLQLRWFRDRRFSVASGGIALAFFAMFGTFFLITQYLQLVLGYGTFEAGVKQLPFAAALMVVAPQTPRLSMRFGANRVVAAGLATVAVGMLMFGLLTETSPYSVIATQMSLLAIGMALTMSPLTGAIMAAVPPSRAGVGSAMNDTTRELGGALGVAVLGSIVASRYTNHLRSAVGALPAPARERALSGLAGALQVAKGSGADGASLVASAKSAYLSGLSVATTVAAGVALVASAVAWRLLPAVGGAHVPAAADAATLGRPTLATELGDLELAPET